MAQNWYECPRCGWRGLLTYRASDVDAHWPPICGQCGETDYHRLVLAPAPGDFAIDAKEPFQRFDVMRQVMTREGLVQRRETIDSVHTLRQIESDSEQRYRNGEGEPLRFRVYNQDASNMDRNSFGESGTIGDRSYDSGKAPQGSDKIGVTRHGTQKPRIPLGPGVKGRAASPLK